MAGETKNEGGKSPSGKVRNMTLTFLLVSVLFLFWYILSDRHTPYTSQARVNGLTIPVSSRVSGNITRIYVKLHSKVKAGDTLFRIDTKPYDLAIQKAEANVDNTSQSVAAKTASVKSAAGRLGASKARLDGTQRNWERVQKVMKENAGALSQTDRDQAETAYTQAVEQVASAEADLERAQQSLGTAGESNPQLIMAIKELEQARLDLAYCYVIATAGGYIETLNIDLGYYAVAGQPIATMISDSDIWIEADLKENNISLMKAGDEVEFSLDGRPGEIFSGKVRSIGHGVSTGNTNRGELPDVSGNYGWLKDPQRFPVIISFDAKKVQGSLRLGGQSDVLVFNEGKGGLLAWLGKMRIRIISFLSYVR